MEEKDELELEMTPAGNGGEEVTETVSEESPAGATARDSVRGRLRDRYPDREFGEDEEGYYGAMGDYMDESESQLGSYRESERKLLDVLNKNEMAAVLFADMASGNSPMLNLVTRFGPQILEELQTEEGRQAFEEAAEKYRLKKEMLAKEASEWDENIGRSLEELDRFGEERGLDDERKAAVFDKIWALGTKAIMGTYTAEDYELGLKALDYDDDVATAREEGEVTGRNSRIRERLRRSDRSKSMPTPMEGGTGPGEDGSAGMSFEERLDADPWGLSRYRNPPQ